MRQGMRRRVNEAAAGEYVRQDLREGGRGVCETGSERGREYVRKGSV